MSLFLGALGGAGEAAQQVGMQNQKLWGEEDLQAQRAQLETQKALTLQEAEAALKLKTADTARTQQVDRITDASKPLVQQALDSKYAGAVPADPSTWTPEQQAVVDQSRSMDEQALLRDPKIRDRAAIMTGDISPTESAKLASSSEITQMKMQSLLDRASDRNATMSEVANIRAESLKYGYELRLQAAEERANKGKIDTATGRMLITSEDANIKASTTQMTMLNSQLQTTQPTKDGKPNPAYTQIQDQINGLKDDITQSKSNKEAYLKSMNLMPGGPPTEKDVKAATKPADASKPAASAATLPAGSKQIGTSNGKPVYETPDGKRFIAQ